jgi:hypothetical protein
VKEALISASSAKEHMPDLPILLYTQPPDIEGLDVPVFEDVIFLEEVSHSYADKINSWLMSPFERTLAMDTDTYFYTGCLELFEMLEKYDMALAYEYFLTEYKFETVPLNFPSINTGVIVYRKNDVTAGIFRRAKELQRDIYGQYVKNDQPAMRHAIWESDARVFILRPEYNFRIHYGAMIGGACNPVILHDHNPDPAKYKGILHKKHATPRYYGPIRPEMIFHWYFHKALKSLKRRLKKFGGSG